MSGVSLQLKKSLKKIALVITEGLRINVLCSRKNKRTEKLQKKRAHGRRPYLTHLINGF